MRRFFARPMLTPEQAAAQRVEREAALHQIIRGTVIVALLALVTNTISSLADPLVDWSSTLLYAIMFLVLVGLALARSLPLAARGGIFLGLMYAVGGVALVSLGLSGAGRLYLVGFAVIATTVFGNRAGLAAAVLSVLTWLAVAAGYSTGVFTAAANDPALFINWVAGATSLLLVLVTLIIPQRQFWSTRLAAVTAEQQNAALRAAQGDLAAQTAALEAASAAATAARAEQASQAQALERRAALLALNAEVAHAAAAVRDLDELLLTSVNLISLRFNFYHAGLFLLDDAREWAVLRAANSAGGQRMLARGHRLRVGQEGIVGYVAGTGRARIALDVGADAVHFVNPDLPETHSEMAAPLRARGVVLGVLDVQSVETGAFTPEDAEVLQSLADQIGLALDNTRLLQETQRRLSELQQLQSEARRAAGLSAGDTPAAYRYDGLEVRPLVVAPEIMPPETAQRALAVPEAKAGPSARTTLSVPLQFGDQHLGTIELRREGEAWSDEDLELTAAIADRMALAMESAQLFEQTRARAQQLQTLTEAAIALTGPQFNTDEALEQICAGAMRLFGADGASVWLSTGPEELERRLAVGREGADTQRPHAKAGDGPAGRALATGQAERAEGPAAGLGAQAALAVPMVWQGQTRGVLLVSQSQPGRAFSGDDERMALLYAGQAASTLENARLFGEAEQRLGELEAVNNISLALSTQLDLKSLLPLVGAKVFDTFGVNNGFVALYDSRTNQIEFPYFVEAGQQLSVTARPLGQGLTSIVIQRRRPLLINQDAARRTAELGALQQGAPAKSWLGVPVLAGDDVIGVLCVQDIEREGLFSQADARLLSTIAANVGIAIQNARLFEETQRRAEQLATAAEVSRAASSAANPDDLIVSAVELIRERFERSTGVYYAALFLIDESRGWARLRHATGEAGRVLLERQHKLEVGGNSMVGWATANRKPRIALDVGAEPVRFANPLLPDTRSEMALPLIVGEAVLGALDVQSPRPAAFTDSDVAVLQTMVDQIAIALRNAQLLTATQRTQSFLDSVVENLPVMLSVKDAYDLRYVRWNRSSELLTGIGRDEILRQTDYEFFPPEAAAVLASDERQVLSAKQQVEIPEEPVQTRTRGTRVLHTRKIPILDETGQPQYLLSISEDVTERKEADVRLRAAQERYRSLVETLPAVIYAVEVPVGGQGATTYISPQVQSLLGYSPEEWTSDPDLWIKLLHPEDREAVLKEVARQNALGNALDIEYRSLTRDGRVVWFHNQSQGAFDITGRVLTTRGIMFDITARKQAEAALKAAQETAQRRAQLLAAASDVARAMTGSLDREQLLRTAVNLIRERFGFYHASIFTVEQGSDMAVLRESTGEAGAQLKARRHQLAVGSRSLVGSATASRRPVIVQDVTTDPNHFKNPLLPDTRAEAVVPLLAGDMVVGALDVQSTLPYAFGAEDVAILVTMADQLAVALQNARLFDQTARQARRESQVVEITGRIRAAGDMDAMLRTAVTELRRALGASRAAVRLERPDAARAAGAGEPGGGVPPALPPAADASRPSSEGQVAPPGTHGNGTRKYPSGPNGTSNGNGHGPSHGTEG
ncbi:MAG: GAF domain-containing protein [Anaerolineales bacterium]|nr:GAF domain-containing protein [Anaerolineales bacterium]